MRFLLIIGCIFLVSACAMKRTAQDAYREGRYLESIELIAQSVEEKGEGSLNAEDLKRFKKMVTNVMEHYEKALSTASQTDHDSRIQSYEALLQMKRRLTNRFFTPHVSFFDNKYDIMQLRKILAEEYYLSGKSLKCSTTDCYAMQAALYRQGSEHYKYKDIEKLYKQANTKYMNMAAQEYYDQGKKYAAMQLYRSAAENFAKAVEVYQPLGNYKDSKKLLNIYNKKYRTEEAQANYQQATWLVEQANTRKAYREVASYYRQAAESYSPYGDYKGAEALADKYEEKGRIKVYISSIYSGMIKQIFNKGYYHFVTNSAMADISIEIDSTTHYHEHSQPPEITAMSENVLDKTINVTNANGEVEKKDIYKTYYFNVKKYVNTNEVETTIRLNVSGLYSYNRTENVHARSKEKKYVYTGDVPSKYRNYTKGELLSRSSLYYKCSVKEKDYIEDALQDIFKRLEEL